jgi:gluconate 2-dehydrogenase gamma chain
MRRERTMPTTPERRADTSGVDRRTFLRWSAGTMALLAVQTAFQLDAVAQEEGLGGYQFFNRDEGALMEALAGRIWPGDADDPGAIEAGAATYVDRALAGPYAAYQQSYRVILRELLDAIEQRHGVGVRELEDAQLDQLLGELESREIGEGPLSRVLDDGPKPSSWLRPGFEMIRTHVMEGVFCDPIYGGNRDFAGWRAVNYPGAHYVYSAAEQQVFEPLTKPYQSVADL